MESICYNHFVTHRHEDLISSEKSKAEFVDFLFDAGALAELLQLKSSEATFSFPRASDGAMFNEGTLSADIVELLSRFPTRFLRIHAVHATMSWWMHGDNVLMDARPFAPHNVALCIEKIKREYEDKNINDYSNDAEYKSRALLATKEFPANPDLLGCAQIFNADVVESVIAQRLHSDKSFGLYLALHGFLDTLRSLVGADLEEEDVVCAFLPSLKEMYDVRDGGVAVTETT